MRLRVPSCRGALTVTMSHWEMRQAAGAREGRRCARRVRVRTCETNSLRSSTRRVPTFAAASAQKISAQFYAPYAEAFALTSREWVVVVIQQLFRVKRHETLEHAVANTARADRADDLALEIESIACNVAHLPVSALWRSIS